LHYTVSISARINGPWKSESCTISSQNVPMINGPSFSFCWALTVHARRVFSVQLACYSPTPSCPLSLRNSDRVHSPNTHPAHSSPTRLRRPENTKQTSPTSPSKQTNHGRSRTRPCHRPPRRAGAANRAFHPRGARHHRGTPGSAPRQEDLHVRVAPRRWLGGGPRRGGG
jgi:hypothetical protein